MKYSGLVALTCLALLTPLASVAQSVCGPVVLAGHDADDHGFEAVYARIFDGLLSNVTNGNSGILAIGPDAGTSAQTWIMTVASLMVVPQALWFVNDAAISTIDFSTFAILHVPSDDQDTPGGISLVEAALLNSRSADVAQFVGDGGGLFGLTQGEIPNGWGYITDVAPIGHVDVPPSGQLPSTDLFDDLTATPEGQLLGLDDVNLDGCCFHNVFTSFPTYLRVLAFANEPNDPGFDGEAVFIGGISTCVDEQATLAVEYDQVGVARLGAGVVVRWSTLSEDQTTGFVVKRSAQADGSRAVAIGAFVAAQGPGSNYELLDDSPASGATWYYVQEVDTRGMGVRSITVQAPGSGGAGQRSRK